MDIPPQFLVGVGFGHSRTQSCIAHPVFKMSKSTSPRTPTFHVGGKCRGRGVNSCETPGWIFSAQQVQTLNSELAPALLLHGCGTKGASQPTFYYSFSRCQMITILFFAILLLDPRLNFTLSKFFAPEGRSTIAQLGPFLKNPSPEGTIEPPASESRIMHRPFPALQPCNRFTPVTLPSAAVLVTL